MFRIFLLCLTFAAPCEAQTVWGANSAGTTSQNSILTNGTATAAGSNQGTATALTAHATMVTSVAANTGVILAASTNEQIVVNEGANTLNVYPPSSAQINSLGTNVAFQIAAGSGAVFLFSTSTQFYAYFSSFQ